MCRFYLDICLDLKAHYTIYWNLTKQLWSELKYVYVFVIYAIKINDVYYIRKHQMCDVLIGFHWTVKQLEVNQQDESSDSSDDDDDDDEPEEMRKATKDQKPDTKFDFSPDVTKKFTNGNDMKRNKTVRRTKQKSYWHGFLTGILEK